MKRSSGFSPVEVLATLALAALLMGMGVSNLRLLGNPAQSAAADLAQLLRQARTKAMISSSAYTVFPISPGRIAVRHGKNCTDPNAVLDEKLRLKFPSGVNLADTQWSVCFASKGLPTDKVEVYVRDLANSSLNAAVEVNLRGPITVR